MTIGDESMTADTTEAPASASDDSRHSGVEVSGIGVRPLGSKVGRTAGGLVIDANEHLEHYEPSAAMSIPTMKSVTKGVTKNVRDVIRVFEIEGAHIEVTQEQIDRVRMMHDRFAESMVFCFNYNTLLLVAAVIAGLGLISDSSSTIIASMLVSPIMGPVCGMAYGTTIQDWKMVRRSIRTECLSMVFCVVVGAVIGGMTGPTDLANDWPTSEMTSRATLTNFLVALPIAFFSGLGVAVSLLDEQTNSLVGVAISASLLPPAVNAGILWVAYAFNNETNDFTHDDYRRGGFYSLFLTLANIILIWISSMLMFRLKEVLPIKKKIFWEDLKIARKIYQKKAFLSDENCNSLLENQTAAAQAQEEEAAPAQQD